MSGQSGVSADIAEYAGDYFKSPQSAEEREPMFCCFCDVGVMRPLLLLGSPRNLTLLHYHPVAFRTEQTFDFIISK